MVHDQQARKVLVTPLDWGLGHATRSIPVIHELQNRKCEVVIATSGDALLLLRTEFPTLQFFELPAYRARYSTRIPFMTGILLQMPKFLWAIRKEHVQTQRIIREQKIDFVISDSRFGCWSTRVPTIFISHQTTILMPSHLKWLESAINFFNRQQIKKFTQCWIPDFPSDRVTDKLTSVAGLNIRFIGMLSRFKKPKILTQVKYNYLILISGPEPQRTILEQFMRKNIHVLPGKKMIVKGQPHLGQEIIQTKGFDEVGHLQAGTLQHIIESSEMIIARSGYSTVMDLAALGKKAFFIPTPGQTEQELLALELEKRKIAYYQNQKDLDLIRANEEMENYTGFSNFDQPESLLSKTMDEFLISLPNA